MQQTLDCTVDHFLFPKAGQISDKGYVILSVRAPKNSDPTSKTPSTFCVKGYLPGIASGAHVSVTGEWRHDPKWGDFFAATSYEDIVPTTAEGIRKYLSGGFLDGVGPETASRLVAAFGKDTLEVIDKHPERMLEVSGIGEKKVLAISRSWKEQKDMRSVMLFLKTYDVGNLTALKIYRKYGDQAVRIIKENPYVLAEDESSGEDGGIKGVGFRKADKIALSMGVAPDSPHRLRSALIYVLSEESDNGGNVYTLKDDLISKTFTELNAGAPGATPEMLGQRLSAMASMEDVKVETGENGERVYLPMFWHSERGVARRLLAKAEAGRAPRRIDFDSLEDECGIEFDDIQKDAVETASRSGVCVITGGPGTGKTTTMKGVIAEARSRGLKILLAAPTGRAAKRLAETTGMEAMTIHRTLEYGKGEHSRSSFGFQRNEGRPLKGDLLVVDESSMIDLILMYSLLKAVPEDMRVVLVGDADQLPSVGAGCVLRDVIASGAVPVVKLTRIFRQAQGSMIVTNAHAINRGAAPSLPCNLTPGGGDFCFIRREGENTADVSRGIADEIVHLVSEYLPEMYGYKPSDIQVLSPMRRGPVGTEELNRRLQDKLNPMDTETETRQRNGAAFLRDIFGVSEDNGPRKRSLRCGATEFRTGDRVMQTQNNYDWDVFNGDIGTVTDVDPEERSLQIDFDGKKVKAEKSAFEHLELAYATTVHKSQGSEYPVMIMPVVMGHYVMLARNLVYTAVTRSKALCILIGDSKALFTAIRNDAVLKRNSALMERLRGKSRDMSIEESF